MPRKPAQVDGVTVPEIIRALGATVDRRAAWAIGAKVRTLFEDRHGFAPPKALRPKSRGGGSHCFAVYPVSMRAEIEGIVRSHGRPDANPSQMSFFA